MNNIRFSGTDPTMSAPGFFEQAAFPILTPLSAGLLPMTPTGLPGTTPPKGGAAGPNTLLGIKLDKNGLPQMGKNVQKDYINNIIATYMASAQQLAAGFSTFLGAPAPR